MIQTLLLHVYAHHLSSTVADINVSVLTAMLHERHFFFFLVFLPFLGPLPATYGGSQARGLIGAVAAGLHHSHSNAGSLTY